MLDRRTFVCSSAVGLARTGAAQSSDVPQSIRDLRPMTSGVKPITSEERQGRIEKARQLMRRHKLDAIFLESGSSLFYFTGVRSSANGSFLGWTLPVRGEPGWIAPASAEKQAREAAGAGADLRVWREDEGQEIARLLRDRGAGAGRIGIEERVRFSVFDGIRKALPKSEFESADPVTAGLRMIKSPSEIALMQRANDITIAAYRAALTTLREGITQFDLRGAVTAAYQALGVHGDVMVSFGKYTAFPHGSIQPQKLQEGDVVLLDDGCSVDG